MRVTRVMRATCDCMIRVMHATCDWTCDGMIRVMRALYDIWAIHGYGPYTARMAHIMRMIAAQKRIFIDRRPICAGRFLNYCWRSY